MSRCTDGRGVVTDHAAEGWLMAPEGRRIQAMCRFHALACVEEYATRLDETWTFDDGRDGS